MPWDQALADAQVLDIFDGNVWGGKPMEDSYGIFPKCQTCVAMTCYCAILLLRCRSQGLLVALKIAIKEDRQKVVLLN
jgi:hypothetical protein